MLPLEILLSSIDIGVDRVGSRLPLQGRCACLRLDLDPLIFLHIHIYMYRSLSMYIYIYLTRCHLPFTVALFFHYLSLLLYVPLALFLVLSLPMSLYHYYSLPFSRFDFWTLAFLHFYSVSPPLPTG